MTSSPPRSLTVTSSPGVQKPLRQAAVTAAQAPVPQAMVSPLPRSHTRMTRQFRSITWMNSVFTRSGNKGSFSIRGPSCSRSRFMGSPPKMTQWGLPMDTQVMVNSLPAMWTLRPTTLSPGRRTGMLPGLSSARPMSTATRTARPFFSVTAQVFMPLLVSICSRGLRAMPSSYRYLATQRMALPHMAPSLPSALNMRIFASAMSEGQMRIMPSPPTPLCRSDSRTARASGLAMGCLKQSR